MIIQIVAIIAVKRITAKDHNTRLLLLPPEVVPLLLLLPPQQRATLLMQLQETTEPRAQILNLTSRHKMVVKEVMAVEEMLIREVMRRKPLNAGSAVSWDTQTEIVRKTKVKPVWQNQSIVR